MARSPSDVVRSCALPGLLLTAALLRLAWLDSYPSFTPDEGRVLFFSQSVARGEGSAALNLPSWIGPWLCWMVAPFAALLDPSPAVVRLVPALAGVLAVWLAWRLGRRWQGDALGLTAAALIATGCVWVIWSRLGNSVCLVPPAVLLSLLTLERLTERPSPARGLALGAALGLTLSLHLSAALVLPLFATLVLADRRHRRWLGDREVLLCGVVGLGLLCWPVVEGLGSLLGLGEELATRTRVDTGPTAGIVERVSTTATSFGDALGGGRVVTDFGGARDGLLSWPGAAALLPLVALLLGGIRSVRERDSRGLALVAGLVLSLALVAWRSGQLDLSVEHRERYLLVPLVVASLIAARGLVPGPTEARRLWRLLPPALLALILATQLLGLRQDWFGVLAQGGESPSPVWWIAEGEDARSQAAGWINARLQPGEQGLLLAGDDNSLGPILPLVDRGLLDEGRLAYDYIQNDPAELVAVLQRTAPRRRFLVDLAGGPWEARIRAGLQEAGYGEPGPALEPKTADGRPVLRLWELSPEAARR